MDYLSAFFLLDVMDAVGCWAGSFRFTFCPAVSPVLELGGFQELGIEVHLAIGDVDQHALRPEIDEVLPGASLSRLA